MQLLSLVLFAHGLLKALGEQLRIHKVQLPKNYNKPQRVNG
jgi:hypothetical protein